MFIRFIVRFEPVVLCWHLRAQGFAGFRFSWCFEASGVAKLTPARA